MKHRSTISIPALTVVLVVGCSKDRADRGISAEPFSDAQADAPIADAQILDAQIVDVRADAPGDAPTDAPTPQLCPASLPGPKLVKLAAPDGTAYCMDQREVTAGEYVVFAKAMVGKASGQTAGCEWNLQYEPMLIPPNDPEMTGMTGHCLAEVYNPAKYPDRAVECVDWCDAAAYCAWAGKRLCGKVGGGIATLAGMNDPKQSEWANACTQGGKTKYPWGDTYTPGQCIDPTKIQQEGQTAKDVTSTSGSECHGALDGFADVYDLVGSVQEWTAECDVQGESCAFHGYGSMSSSDVPVSCDGVGPAGARTTHYEVGFRCCADVVPGN